MDNLSCLISSEHGLYLIIKYVKSLSLVDEDLYEFILENINSLRGFSNFDMFIHKIVHHLKMMITVCSKAKKLLLKFDNYIR